MCQWRFLPFVALGLQGQGWGTFPRISPQPKGLESWDLQGKARKYSREYFLLLTPVGTGILFPLKSAEAECAGRRERRILGFFGIWEVGQGGAPQGGECPGIPGAGICSIHGLNPMGCELKPGNCSSNPCAALGMQILEWQWSLPASGISGMGPGPVFPTSSVTSG